MLFWKTSTDSDKISPPFLGLRYRMVPVLFVVAELRGAFDRGVGRGLIDAGDKVWFGKVAGERVFRCDGDRMRWERREQTL